jgi:hypothetical protein
VYVLGKMILSRKERKATVQTSIWDNVASGYDGMDVEFFPFCLVGEEFRCVLGVHIEGAKKESNGAEVEHILTGEKQDQRRLVVGWFSARVNSTRTGQRRLINRHRSRCVDGFSCCQMPSEFMTG